MPLGVAYPWSCKWEALVKEHSFSFSELLTKDASDRQAAQAGLLPQVLSASPWQLDSIAVSSKLQQTVAAVEGTGQRLPGTANGHVSFDEELGQAEWTKSFCLCVQESTEQVVGARSFFPDSLV